MDTAYTSQDPVYVFDLDGVITDPRDSSINREAVGHIHRLLEQGSYVAVNTGRSYHWVQAHLLSLLQELGASEMFDHLYIVCEKGGESIIWMDGRFMAQPSRFALTSAARETTRRIYEAHQPTLPTMFWDDTKRTMATIEKHPTANLDQFRTQQHQLTALLRAAFAGQEVRIDPTTIATDVESPAAGKHAGAELIYEWMTDCLGSAHRHFVSFGDSRSDYEMARYFAGQGSQSVFVFVGSPSEVFEEDPAVTLVRTKAVYAAGTCEYFAALLR